MDMRTAKTNFQAVKLDIKKINPSVSCITSSFPDNAKLSAVWPSSLKYCSPHQAGVWSGGALEFFCMDTDVGIDGSGGRKRGGGGERGLKRASGPDPDGVERNEWSDPKAFAATRWWREAVRDTSVVVYWGKITQSLHSISLKQSQMTQFTPVVKECKLLSLVNISSPQCAFSPRS